MTTGLAQHPIQRQYSVQASGQDTDDEEGEQNEDEENGTYAPGLSLQGALPTVSLTNGPLTAWKHRGQRGEWLQSLQSPGALPDPAVGGLWAHTWSPQPPAQPGTLLPRGSRDREMPSSSHSLESETKETHSFTLLPHSKERVVVSAALGAPATRQPSPGQSAGSACGHFKTSELAFARRRNRGSEMGRHLFLVTQKADVGATVPPMCPRAFSLAFPSACDSLTAQTPLPCLLRFFFFLSTNFPDLCVELHPFLSSPAGPTLLPQLSLLSRVLYAC